MRLKWCLGCCRSWRPVGTSSSPRSVESRGFGSLCCEQKQLSRHLLHQRHYHVAVVGAGPAGFYVTQHLARRPDVHVHLLERLPTPYGLVRYGVAPDHPEVKNVITTFSKTAALPNVRLLADVCVGVDVSVEELRRSYDAVVLAYGAEDERRLNVPGERLKNVVTARRLVAWYNGLPGHQQCPVDLQGVESAVVVGMGNVALDVLRMLTAPVDTLRTTDITGEALKMLDRAALQRVTLLGRRGPLHAAFTIKELREQIRLFDVRADWSLYPYQELQLEGLERPRRRLTELMMKSAAAADASSGAEKTWALQFLRRPLELLGDDGGRVRAMRVGVNRSSGDGQQQQVVETDVTETLPCQLVVTSVGYRGRIVDPAAGVEFDQSRGVLVNEEGRVRGAPGLYAAGWIATGPVGVINTTMTSSFAVARLVLEDLLAGGSPRQLQQSPDQLLQLLQQERGVSPIGFEDWLRLDREEIERGKALGKPREKVTCVDEMRRIIWSK